MQEEVFVAKQTGDPFQLMDTHSFNDIFKKPLRVLIGHNRYATTGKVTRRNAHPFEFPSVVGAHNGTLTNKHSLTDGHKFEVDSEALFNEIHVNGISKAIAKAKGAWALTYFNKEDNTLNFIRNKERPLSYIFSEDKKVVFWASEAWMLTAVLHREGYKVDKIQNFPEDALHTFDISFESFNKFEPFGKPHVKAIKSDDGGAVVSQYQKKPLVVAVGNTGGQSPVVKGASSTYYDEKYLGKHSVTFEMVSLQTDAHQAEYMLLRDKNQPEYDVRLYFNQSRLIRSSVGRYCKGNITSVGIHEGKPYYKVSPWSVDLIEDVEEEEVFFLPTLHGRMVDKETFNRKYHTCGWCSQSLTYGEVCHVVDEAGTVLCKDCLAEPQVQNLIK